MKNFDSLLMTTTFRVSYYHLVHKQGRNDACWGIKWHCQNAALNF